MRILLCILLWAAMVAGTGATLVAQTGIPQATAAQAGGDDRWQVGLQGGGFIWDIRLLRLSGDSLVFRQADTVGAVSVQQVKELRLIRKSVMRIGDGGGAGGAISALTGSDDEIYDLNTLDYAERIRAIQQIFLVHPPAP